MSQFRITRNLYLEYLSDFTFPLTYEDWFNADDDYKAVLLFVNFFEQIELAWYKTRFSFVLEEDAVSQVNVYLMKNVEFIKKFPKRFSASYIYTVAANCLRSLTYIERDINRDKLESSNEQYVNATGDIVDLYDLTPNYDDSHEVAEAKEAVWAIIAKMGPKAEKVVNKLLNPEDSLKKSAAGRNLNDRLRDVNVTSDEFDKILNDLRNNSELLYNLQIIVDEDPEPVGDAKRDEFVAAIHQCESIIASSKSEKQVKDCYKSLKKMIKELREYDNYHLAFNI